MSDSNLSSIAIAAESTFGTAPTTGFKTFRYTGESLNFNISNTQSAQIRADRNVNELVRTDASSSGDLNFELSYGTLDDLLEGLLCSSWDTSVLKNGAVAKSFSIEKNFGAGVTNPFHLFKGMTPSSMGLSVSAGDMVTGNMSFLGKTMATAASKQNSSAIAAATTSSVMNAVNNVAVLTEGTTNMLGASSDKVMSLDISIENNLRVRNSIGTLGATSIGMGQFVVTGSMSVYFASGGVFNKFLDNTDSSLSFQVSDGTNSYTFLLPKIEYTGGQVVAGSTNSDVMAEMEFQAKYDATSANQCTLKITRA